MWSLKVYANLMTESSTGLKLNPKRETLKIIHVIVAFCIGVGISPSHNGGKGGRITEMGRSHSLENFRHEMVIALHEIPSHFFWRLAIVGFWIISTLLQPSSKRPLQVIQRDLVESRPSTAQIVMWLSASSSHLP